MGIYTDKFKFLLLADVQTTISLRLRTHQTGLVIPDMQINGMARHSQHTGNQLGRIFDIKYPHII